MSAKAHGLYACSHRRFSPSGEILSYDQYNYYGSNYRHKDCAPIFGYLFVCNRLIFLIALPVPMNVYQTLFS